MKVCFIIPKGLPLPCVKGGAIETLVNDIIDENEKMKKLDITVVSIYDEKAKQKSENYAKTKFIYVKNNFKYKLKALKVRILNLFGNNFNTYNEIILDKIKKNSYDYIIVEDGAYMSFKSYLKYFNKDQMILHFHHNGESDKDTDATYFMYIGVSEFVANTFRKSSSITNINILRNGIRIDKFDKQVTVNEINEIRSKYKFSDDDFLIIFCGRLIPEKGVLELVKAVKNIEHDQIKLMIVGSINFGKQELSPYLLELENEMNSSNGRIVLTGYIESKDLYRYYQSVDLGVMSSVCEESASLVTVEMLVNKVPLIITKSGGAPEYASHDTVIIPKDDDLVNNIKTAILNLYHDPDKRTKMKETGYEHGKQFTTKSLYNGLIEILARK